MCCFCFFFKQKTAYEMRISDWSSDVCSSDLVEARLCQVGGEPRRGGDAEVGGDQQLLQLLQRLVVQLALGEDAGDALAELGGRAGEPGLQALEIGRASCRERVCQSVYISVVAESLQKTHCS